MAKYPIIMGIDPGIATTGVGTIRAKPERPEFIGQFGIKTEKIHDVTGTESDRRRVRIISRRLHAIIDATKPDLIVSEAYVFFGGDSPTALIDRLIGVAEGQDFGLSSVHLRTARGQVRENKGGSSATTTGRILGMINEVAAGYDIRTEELTTQSIKKLVVGRAGSKAKPVDKKLVMQYVSKILGIQPKSGHTSDALAAAIAGQKFLGGE